jgi:hypothetical protein
VTFATFCSIRFASFGYAEGQRDEAAPEKTADDENDDEEDSPAGAATG